MNVINIKNKKAVYVLISSQFEKYLHMGKIRSGELMGNIGRIPSHGELLYPTAGLCRRRHVWGWGSNQRYQGKQLSLQITFCTISERQSLVRRLTGASCNVYCNDNKLLQCESGHKSTPGLFQILQSTIQWCSSKPSGRALTWELWMREWLPSPQGNFLVLQI